MTSTQKIGEFLESPDWTEGEKFIIKWQFNNSLHLLGDFKTALIGAIKQADHGNLARLALGFPREVEGFRQWAYGDLGSRLRAAGLEI